MPNVQFKRGDTATLNSTSITDGMIYFDTEANAVYMDNGSTRLKYQTEKSLTNAIEDDNIGIPTCQVCDNTLVPYSLAKSTPIDSTSGIYIPARTVAEEAIGTDYMAHGSVVDTISYLTTNKSIFKLMRTFDITQFTPNSTYQFTVDKDFTMLMIIWKDLSTSSNTDPQSYKCLHKIGTQQMQGEVDRSQFTYQGRIFNSTKSNNLITITFGHYYNGRIIDGEINSAKDTTYVLPYQIYTA